MFNSVPLYSQRGHTLTCAHVLSRNWHVCVCACARARVCVVVFGPEESVG